LLPKPLLFSALQHPNTINRLINRDLAGVAKSAENSSAKLKSKQKEGKTQKYSNKNVLTYFFVLLNIFYKFGNED
jgi:hypothetical protein